MSGAAFDAYSQSYEGLVGDSIAFSGLKHDFFLTAKAHFLARLFAERFGAASAAGTEDAGCMAIVHHDHGVVFVC